MYATGDQPGRRNSIAQYGTVQYSEIGTKPVLWRIGEAAGDIAASALIADQHGSRCPSQAFATPVDGQCHSQAAGEANQAGGRDAGVLVCSFRGAKIFGQRPVCTHRHTIGWPRGTTPTLCNDGGMK